MDGYRGPYHVATIPGRDGADRYMRHNDGALVVMGKDGEGDDAPCLIVPMRVRAKRGQAWSTTDLKQEAFAEAVADALNALWAAAELAPAPSE